MARHIYSLIISFFLIVGVSAAVNADTTKKEIPFVHGGLEYESQRFDGFLRRHGASEKISRSEYIKKANTASTHQEAIAALKSALFLEANDAKGWLDLATAYLDAYIPKRSNLRYYYPQRASVAAYRAYKLAKDKKIRAKALGQLGEALKRRSYWRPAINALKASLSIQENLAVRTSYTELRAQHGFRIINYTVDSETETPRLCIQFSEILSKGRIDFSKFITVDGKEPAGVAKDDKQLCVEGLLHGKRYLVKVREGLPAKVGEKILKTSDLIVYVRDRKPGVRFTGKGYVLPKTGQSGIPLITTNTNKVGIEIYRVGDRALNQTILENYMTRKYNGYSINRLKENLGQKVWSGQMTVKSKLNKDVTTALPVTKAIKKLKPGLYVAYAWPAENKPSYNTSRASQWFVVSDIGLSTFTGKGGMHTFVRSLTTAEPVKGAKVRLIARNNEVLGTGVTDENGHVKFDKGLLNGKASQTPHLIVAERKEGDYAFLDVTHSSFDLTDRGVSGRSNPGELDAFLYTERGVYRTGEEVYFTALLRDKAGKSVQKVPLTLVIRRADGVEFKRVVLQDEGEGGRSHILSLPANAGSGRWSAAVYTDPKQSAVGQVSFLVEDYTPQRMELDLTSDKKTIDPLKSIQIAAKGRYLYGAPASNMVLNGEVLIRENAGGLEKYKGFRFGVHNERFLNINKQLSDLAKTDAEGAAKLVATLPKIPSINKLLEAQFTIRLNEPGGRSLSKQISFKLKPSRTMIGIRPLFRGNHVGEGSPAEFEIIAIDSEGNQKVIKGLKWELLRVQNRYQWYADNNGYWNYRTIRYTRSVGNGVIDTKGDGSVRISRALDWGSYRLEITSDDANGPQGSYKFSSGWYSTANTDRPDKLEIALDKKQYKEGDTLTVNLSPKHDGKALVAIVDDKVLALKSVSVSKKGTQVSFPVGKNWGAGVYVTAVFFRPLDAKARRMPTRSIGIAWVNPDVKQKTLGIAMNVPEKIRPNTEFNIPIKIKGLKAGSQAKVVISAVDVGILNLTRYKSPKPDDWYYGQRLLGTEIRDLYGKLIDGMQAAAGKIRSGGGGGPGGFAGTPPAKTVEPVALYSGIVIVDKDGNANVKFDIPAFDGTIRLMAVAWNNDQLGSAEKDVIVRDPVVVIGTAPKFLTSGDKSNLQFSLDNVEGAEGDYTYKVTGTGSVNITTTENKVKLATKERKQFSVPITAKNYGPAQLELTISGPNGFKLSRTFKFNVNPAAPDITRRLISKLPKNGGKLSITKDVTQGLIPETVKVSVNVDNSVVLDVPGLLLALDRYPYGCAEQTTSRALPLLYLSSVAEKAGVAGVKGSKDRIKKAIIRLSGMQSSNGSFSMWSTYYGGNPWLTAYVTDFLTRARELGHNVPNHVIEQALNNLHNTVKYSSDFKSGGEGLAYALYVLARNGRASIGDLRYFVDAKLDNFSTALAKAQLGAALAMYGDQDRANQAYRSALSEVAHSIGDKSYRSDYGSSLRDGAAAITLISETKTTGTSVVSFTKLLQKARAVKKYTSTQENAWMLLAAHALQKESKNIRLAVNGVPHSGSLKEILKTDNLNDGEYTVTNRGKEDIQAALTITGHGAYPQTPASEGFTIKREFFTLDGKPVKLDKVKQNDRFVVVVTVTETDAKRGRLILVDRIPAGFEIENPKLVEGSNIKSLPWLGRANQIEYTQFKDDRFYAAFNMSRGFRSGKPASMTTAYIVRAISPGTYLHPAAKVEDMYRLDRFARTGAGKVTIVAK